MTIPDRLRALKMGESTVFSSLTSTTQLSSAVARLRAYGYRFVTHAKHGGVMATRVPRPGNPDDVQPEQPMRTEADDLADLI